MIENQLLDCIDVIQEQTMFANLDVLTSLFDAYVKYDTISEQMQLDQHTSLVDFVQEATDKILDPDDSTGANVPKMSRMDKFKKSKFGSKVVNFIEMVKTIFKEIVTIIKRLLLKRRIDKVIKIYSEKTGDNTIPFFGPIEKMEDAYTALSNKIIHTLEIARNSNGEISGVKPDLNVCLDLSASFTTLIESFELNKFKDIEPSKYLDKVCNEKCTVKQFKSYFEHVSDAYSKIQLMSAFITSLMGKMVDQMRFNTDDEEAKKAFNEFEPVIVPLKKLGNDILNFVSLDIKRHVEYLKALTALNKAPYNEKPIPAPPAGQKRLAFAVK